MKAKKSFGQHFLINRNLCQAIASALPVDESIDLILEVGPGKGALTEFLLELPLPYAAIELDWDMVDEIEARFPQLADHVHMLDFSEGGPSCAFQRKEYRSHRKFSLQHIFSNHL